MKIPHIPAPDGISGKQWEGGTNGKGSKRRPDGKIGPKTSTILDKPRGNPGHTKIVYKDGQKIVYVNGVRQ